MRDLLSLFHYRYYSLLKEGSDSVSPTIQIDLSTPLGVHVITQSDLSKLLPTQHPQTLSKLPTSHSEVIPIRNVS